MKPSEKNIKRAAPSPISNPTAFMRKNIALQKNKLRAYKSIFRLIKISLHKYRSKSEKYSQEIAKIIEIKKDQAGLFPLKILQTILSIFDLIKLSLIKKHNHLRDKEHELISEEINLN